MKRKTAYTAIASSMLLALCCACGNQNMVSEIDTAPDRTLSEDTVSDENKDSLPDTAPDGYTDQNALTENQADAAEKIGASPAVSIQMHTDEASENAEDGTCIFTGSYSYPIVSIDGNEEAAAKINAELQEAADSFRSAAEASTLQYAKDDYVSLMEDEELDYPFMPYVEEIRFAATRSDSNVISFVVTQYSYSGGAHGFTSTTGVNYRTQTGAPILFSELSADEAAFHADTLSYNQKLAASDSYREQLFSEDSIFNGDLESVLYADGAWHLSTTGLVFLSDPYMLGPYVAGTIAFTIPYQDLEEMGLKEEYSYAGRLTMQLQPQEEYDIDVNGDGQDDSILFYTEYDSTNADASSIVHFLVNGTDFAQETENGLKERFAEYSFMDYAVYDLDESDDMLDFVFFAYANENDTYVMYNYYYRYEKDGSLTYLGKAPGNITDPTDENVFQLSF